MMLDTILSAVYLAVFPAALLASAPTVHSIPEPTDLALFSMGVAGLLIGRRAAMRRKRRRDGDGKGTKE